MSELRAAGVEGEGDGGEGAEGGVVREHARESLSRSLEELQALRETDALRDLPEEVWERVVATYKYLQDHQDDVVIEMFLAGELPVRSFSRLPRPPRSEDPTREEVAEDYLAVAVFLGIVPPGEGNAVHLALAPPIVDATHAATARLAVEGVGGGVGGGGEGGGGGGVGGGGVETRRAHAPTVGVSEPTEPPPLPHPLHPLVMKKPVSGALGGVKDGEGGPETRATSTSSAASGTRDGAFAHFRTEMDLPLKRIARVGKLRKYVEKLRITEDRGVLVLPHLGGGWETKLVDFNPEVCAVQPRVVVGGEEGEGEGGGEGGGGGGEAGGGGGSAPSDQLEELVKLVKKGGGQNMGAVFMMQVSGGCKTRLAAEMGMSKKHGDVFVVLGVLKNGGVSPLTVALARAITPESSAADVERLCEMAVLALCEVALLAAESSLEKLPASPSPSPPPSSSSSPTPSPPSSPTPPPPPSPASPLPARRGRGVGRGRGAENTGKLSPEQMLRGQEAAVLALLSVDASSVGKDMAAEIFEELASKKYSLDPREMKVRFHKWVPEGGRVVVAIDEVACLREESTMPMARKISVYHSMLRACSKGQLDFVKPLFIGNFLDLHKSMPLHNESPIRGDSTPFYPIALATTDHMLKALNTHVNPHVTLADDDGERLRCALDRLRGRPFFFFDCCLKRCAPHSSVRSIIECCKGAADVAKRKLIGILQDAWSMFPHLRLLISDALVAIFLSSESPTVLAVNVHDGELATGRGLFAAHKLEGDVLALHVHAEPVLCEAMVEWFLEPPSVDGSASERPDINLLLRQILEVNLTTLELSPSEVGTRIEPLLALVMATRVRQKGADCTFRDVFHDMLPEGFELPEVVAGLPLQCVVGKAERSIDVLDRTKVCFGIENSVGPDWATVSAIGVKRVPIYGQAKATQKSSLRTALPTVHQRGLNKTNALRNELADRWYEERKDSPAPGDFALASVDHLEWVSIIFSAGGFSPEALDFVRWWNTHEAHHKHPIVLLESTEAAFQSAHHRIVRGKGRMTHIGVPKKASRKRG